MSRYLRQLDVLDQPRLATTPFTLIGAGAIGSFTAMALAKCGAENITVFDPDTVAAYLADERPCVVRFQVPRDQRVVIEDAVRGRVEWDAGLIPEDQVRLCAIGDGAAWIWKWVEELFPSARQILDYCPL